MWITHSYFIEDIQLCMNLKTICYSSVKHIQVLLKYDYMFQSKMTIIGPQKLLK